MRSPMSVLVLSSLLAVGACQESPTGNSTPTTTLRTTAAQAANWGGWARFFGAPAANPCSAPEHRGLDFWIGRFTLADVTQGPAGFNTIGTAVRGCVITEDFIGTDGIRGRSLSAYDRRTGRWLHTFISELSTNFRLNGGLEGEAMVMRGERLFPLPGGQLFPVVERISWTPLSEGRVRQVIELSVDGGATFPFGTGDFIYQPALAEFPPDPVGTESCGAPEYDAVDPFLGRWKAREGGRVIGHVEMAKDLSGCLREVRIRGRGGYEALSFLTYDWTTDSWHETYVDNRGAAFRLEGGVTPGGIQLAAARLAPGGATSMSRALTVEDGRLAEVWETRSAGGSVVDRLSITYSRY